MVDLPVMRIYQRGGDNWGFSYGLGGVLLLALAAVSVLATVGQYVWPLMVIGVVWLAVKALVDLRRREQADAEECRIHDIEHVGGVVDDDCDLCEMDLMWLRDRERQEQAAERRRAEADRLRAKYNA